MGFIQLKLPKRIKHKIENSKRNREALAQHKKWLESQGLDDKTLKKRLKKYSSKKNLRIFIPELEYSTDNAAMIGIVGYLKYKESLESNLKSTPSPRLSF